MNDDQYFTNATRRIHAFNAKLLEVSLAICVCRGEPDT